MDIHYPNDKQQPQMPQFNFGPWVVPLIVILVAFSAVGTIFYQVGPDEIGVVQRFGKYTRQAQSGLHVKLPFGIETVTNVRVTHVFKEEFGFRTVTAGVRSVFQGRQEQESRMRVARQLRGGSNDPFLEESLMLTGDLNVAIVEWIVQYTIKDPAQYLFRVRDQRETIRNMSEAVMRLVIGDHTINQVLSSGREIIQMEVMVKLQEVMDDYKGGIDIQNVILQNVTPPDPVKPSFNEVNEARQEKERVINQAWERYNRVIPKAKGQAEQQLRAAEGYALERINRARGDADRFSLTYAAYKEAPEVTKRRMYLETVEQVLPGLQDKLFLDESQKSLLPLLNLNPEKGVKEV